MRGRPRAGPARRGGGRRPSGRGAAAAPLPGSGLGGRKGRPACAPGCERAAGAVVYRPAPHFPLGRARWARWGGEAPGAAGRPVPPPPLRRRGPSPALRDRVTHQHRPRGRPRLRVVLPPPPTALRRPRRVPRAARVRSARPGCLRRVESR